MTNYNCLKCKDQKMVFSKGSWRHCECAYKMTERVQLIKMGISTVDTPISFSPISEESPEGDKDWHKSSFILETQNTDLSFQIVAGMFLKEASLSPFTKCYMCSASELLYTYLGKDKKHSTLDDYTRYTNLVIMVDIAEAPNKITPKLVRTVYEARTLKDKPTGFILRSDPEYLPPAYQEEKRLLYHFLNTIDYYEVDQCIPDPEEYIKENSIDLGDSEEETKHKPTPKKKKEKKNKISPKEVRSALVDFLDQLEEEDLSISDTHKMFVDNTGIEINYHNFYQKYKSLQK